MSLSYVHERKVNKSFEECEKKLKETISQFKLALVSEVDVTVRLQKKIEAAKDMKALKIYGTCAADVAFGILQESMLNCVFLPCKMVLSELGDNETQIMVHKFDYVQPVLKNEKLFELFKEGETRTKALADSL